MNSQQQPLDGLILAIYNLFVLWFASMTPSYPQYPQTLFQPVGKPSALQRLITKQKDSLSEDAKLLMDDDPMAIVWQAQADFAKCLRISLT